MVQEIENFYGVYLLYNVNPKFKGRTYIGFTVNPNRRIQQHNKGRHAGGAWRTHGRGPWEMVLIIHGFPNEISALRFEWAWQHPDKSRRLRHVPGKKKKETPFLFRFRVVSEMLRSGPWNRLALTIRWLKQEYVTDFAPDSKPPVHMPIAYGLVKVKKVGSDTGRSKKGDKSEKEAVDDDLVNLSQCGNKYPRCSVCNKRIQAEDHTLKCVHPKCQMVSHTLCLANKFLSDKGTITEVLPVDGTCPKCKGVVLWGDLVRLKTGCYQNLEECGSSDDEEHEDHWANELQTQVT